MAGMGDLFRMLDPDRKIDMTKHPILWNIILTAKVSWLILVYIGPIVVFLWFVFTIIGNMNT